MDRTEREIIDGLFAKLQEAERQGGPRDAEAERHIADHLSRQPAAPYYMAQAILVQEQALAAAQARLAELERELASRPAGGGFLSGLFGGGQPSRAAGHQPGGNPWSSQAGSGHAGSRPAGGPWGNAAPRAGYGHGRSGGFMGGALQTAMAVAGGIVAGNLIADLLTTDAAEAATAGLDEQLQPGFGGEEPAVEDTGDAGDDFGGFDDV